MSEIFRGGSCTGCACTVDVSVVVPVFNAMPFLEEQLHALRTQDTPLTWELLLSDNGSRDDSLALARESASGFHRLIMLDASDRRGAAHARNRGARAAAGALLLFCDADDVADRFWIHAMHRAAAQGGLLAGRLEYDTLNIAQVRAPRETLQHTHTPTYFGHPYAISANFGLSRRLFRDLEGFDERFAGAGGEDVDLPLRAAKRGEAVHFVPDAVVSYRLKATPSDQRRQARAYGAAAPLLVSLHPDLLKTPTVLDDVADLYEVAVDALRQAVRGYGARDQVWRVYYQLAQTRIESRKWGYWRLRRTRDPVQPAPKVRNAVKHLQARLARRLTPSTPGGANSSPWDLALDVRNVLDRPDQHLLGAGLLATANVTVEAIRGGRTWYLNPALDAIVGNIIEVGGYGEDEIATVEAVLRSLNDGRPGLIVNVGANIGTTTVPLVERGWSVVAVEPVPRAAELLRRNVQVNGHSASVTVVEAAVSQVRGRLEMVAGDNLSTSEVRQGHEVDELATFGDVRAEVIDVDSWPLIDLLDDRGVSPLSVTAVWSDTEGCEGAVIATGAELWARGVPLWVEIRPSALLDQGNITDFCALASQHFGSFQTLEDLAEGLLRPTTAIREFVDAVGYGRYNFTNVLMRA